MRSRSILFVFISSLEYHVQWLHQLLTDFFWITKNIQKENPKPNENLGEIFAIFHKGLTLPLLRDILKNCEENSPMAQ